VCEQSVLGEGVDREIAREAPSFDANITPAA